jgi:hypothetical protein
MRSDFHHVLMTVAAKSNKHWLFIKELKDCLLKCVMYDSTMPLSALRPCASNILSVLMNVVKRSDTEDSRNKLKLVVEEIDKNLAG